MAKTPKPKNALPVFPAAVCAVYPHLNPLLAKTRIEGRPEFQVYAEAVTLPSRVLVLATDPDFGLNALSAIAKEHPLVRIVRYLLYAVPSSRIPARFHPMLSWFTHDEFKTAAETWMLFATRSPAEAVANALIEKEPK